MAILRAMCEEIDAISAHFNNIIALSDKFLAVESEAACHKTLRCVGVWGCMWPSDVRTIGGTGT
eukprot:scaffold635749_cov51-Prasinocladus_malaysianus.AAC.1